MVPDGDGDGVEVAGLGHPLHADLVNVYEKDKIEFGSMWHILMLRGVGKSSHVVKYHQ